MKQRKKNSIFLALLGCWATSLFGPVPVSFIRPWSFIFLPTRDKGYHGCVGQVLGESVKVTGFDSNNNKVSPLKLYSPTQDALSMLKGFSADSHNTQVGQQCNVDSDDGIRGHFDVNGDFAVQTSYKVLIS